MSIIKQHVYACALLWLENFMIIGMVEKAGNRKAVNFVIWRQFFIDNAIQK